MAHFKKIIMNHVVFDSKVYFLLTLQLITNEYL